MFGAFGKDITTTFNAWSFNFSEEEQAVFASTNNVTPINSVELTAPKIIGGRRAISSVGGEGIACLSFAVRLTNISFKKFEDDILIEGELRY